MTSRSSGDVLVAGGSGFVGSHLVAALLKRGAARVFVLSRRPATRRWPRGVVTIAHDLSQPLAGAGLPDAIAAVVHCASPPGDSTDLAAIHAANASGGRALLEYAERAGARRFVYVSSGGVAGRRRGPILETTPCAPTTPYLRGKRAAERALARRTRIPLTVVRLYFPYGPGQRRGLLPQLCGRLARGQTIEVGRGGGPLLNPIDVRDAAHAIAVLAGAGGGDAVVNVAGPDVWRLEDLAGALAERLGVEPRLARDSRQWNLHADTRRLVRRVGPQRRRLAAGVAAFARWWRATGGV